VDAIFLAQNLFRQNDPVIAKLCYLLVEIGSRASKLYQFCSLTFSIQPLFSKQLE